ncbi:MAG: NADH-quinone oxidoreductase subunit N [Deltaproteobacteria bacterium]|nr:NADH-quinone oxidoreductase subunit N [Deltaproteobacteria bacterium]
MNQVWIKDLALVSPVIVLSVGALLLILIESFVNRPWPRELFTGLVLFCGIFSLEIFAPGYVSGGTAFNGLIYADGFSWFFTFLLLVGALLALMLGIHTLKDEGIESPGEYYVLLLISTVGAIIFSTSAELITLFLGLEIMSMALYCLCGSAISMRRSSESALKYFLLGSFSSAFMLYGVAILYGLTGSTVVDQIASAISKTDVTAMHFGMALLLIGFVFKLGAVPFHFWAPDVYEGAPTPITAYMACVIKASAVAAMLRVLWTAFGELVLFWSGAIWYLAFFTMVIGNIIALRQRSLKRMLAYSSIAHAGYILVGFLAPGVDFGGGAAILYYIVSYTVMTMGAFGVVLAVSSKHSASNHPDDISRFNGLGYRSPFLGFAMSIFMLSLAGIPPGMAGLLGKVYIFSAAVKADYVGLAIIGVLCSAISSYYYLRVIVAMYFVEADEDESVKVARPSFPLVGALSICIVAAVLLGLFPSALYNSAALVMASF